MLTIFNLLGKWKMYKKMGYKGWYSLIPGFNTYFWYEAMTGNGWNMLKIFIPVYGLLIYKYIVVRNEYDYFGKKKPNYLYFLFFYTFMENSINNIRFGLLSRYEFKEGSVANQENDVVTWLLGKEQTFNKTEIPCCPHCGTPLKENANFCHKCGKNL